MCLSFTVAKKSQQIFLTQNCMLTSSYNWGWNSGSHNVVTKTVLCSISYKL